MAGVGFPAEDVLGYHRMGAMVEYWLGKGNLDSEVKMGRMYMGDSRTRCFTVEKQMQKSNNGIQLAATTLLYLECFWLPVSSNTHAT